MAFGIAEGAKLDTMRIGLSPQPHPMTDELGFDTGWEAAYQSRAYNLWKYGVSTAANSATPPGARTSIS